MFTFHFQIYLIQSVHRNIYTAKQLLIDEYVNNRQTYQQTVEPGLNLIVKDQLRKSLNHRVIGQKFLLNLMQFTNCIDDTKEDFQLMERSLFTLKRLSMENVRTKQIGLILIKMLHHFRKDTLAQKVSLRTPMSTANAYLLSIS